jgi:glutathione S-transferase
LANRGADWSPKFTPDPRKAPKAKLPVLVDEDKTIPDSDQIRDHLEAKLKVDFDEGLTDEQRGQSRALIRMMEEHFYFAVVCDRWLDETVWPLIKTVYFGHLPGLMRGFITRVARKQAIGQVNNQGMGRHSPDERFERARKDIAAVKAVLGDKPFLFGDKPTGADATVVAMFGAAAGTPASTQIRDHIREDKNLMAYLERGREAMYPTG